MTPTLVKLPQAGEFIEGKEDQLLAGRVAHVASQSSNRCL